MKHFAVSASDGTPAHSETRPDFRAKDLGNTAPAFEPDGEDRMTQKGFKTFRRRNAQARQKLDLQDDNNAADLKAATPETTVKRQRSLESAAPSEQPGPEPEAAPPKAAASTTAAPSPPASAAVKPQTIKPAAMSRREPVRAAQVKPMLELDPQARVDIPQEPPVILPTRYDPWLQIPEVPFDFLGQKPSRLPLVSAFRASPTARAFDLLRTRLLHSLKAHGWKRVAITSPSAGGGTTFCAVNLALSLARVPQRRTLLMDMNFRNPGMAAALGIPPHGDMAAFLAGEVPTSEHLQRLSDTLAVGCNCHPDPNASDILHDRRAADVISATIDETSADTILFDLPPVLEHDDVTAFLPQVDGVLLISDGDHTTAAELAACEKMLAGHAPLLGVVLNRAQQSDKTQVTP
ncbi:CpsD/CapB family tyrosine-protein kinase [Pseudophaeobacter sp. EL27]|uniref:CpsD/CapB family tyrosine-protein kinase n=1 Tax=Pseudophaeobacter sp. EL27 TaxID=2107580 RepID=UPI000EFB000D|nr:CpsD/CapB family tyrosine-protein kinase [Pseudophaeobacter sp. EL27]